MKGKIALAVLAVVVAFAGVVGAADFRGNNWGDSPDQVRAVEGAAELERSAEGPYLTYNVDLAGLNDIMATFLFTSSGKLAGGEYLPPEFGYEPFRKWEKILKGKYGKPKIRDRFYSDNEFVKEHYYYGGWRDIESGVGNGHFELCRYWATDETEIWLWLCREGYEAYTMLVYTSIIYRDEIQSQFRDAEAEGF